MIQLLWLALSFDLSIDQRVSQVAPGVWMREGDLKTQGHCNNAIIEMKDYLVVVDSNFPSGAEILLAEAKKLAPKKPVKYVLVTHHHGDHAYGNAFWTKNGAITVAHEGVVAEMKRYEPKRWQEASQTRADVRNLAQLEAGVAAAIEEVGDIDIVVANAGVVAIGNREPHAEDVYNAIVETNLNGVWHTIVATVPSMIRKGRGGSIVLVSSSQGLTGRGGDGSFTGSVAGSTVEAIASGFGPIDGEEGKRTPLVVTLDALIG